MFIRERSIRGYDVHLLPQADLVHFMARTEWIFTDERLNQSLNGMNHEMELNVQESDMTPPPPPTPKFLL